MVEGIWSVDNVEEGVNPYFQKMIARLPEGATRCVNPAVSAFMQAAQGDGGTLEDAQTRRGRTAERSPGSSGSKGRRMMSAGYGTKVTHCATFLFECRCNVWHSSALNALRTCA